MTCPKAILYPDPCIDPQVDQAHLSAHPLSLLRLFYIQDKIVLQTVPNFAF